MTSKSHRRLDGENAPVQQTRTMRRLCEYALRSWRVLLGLGFCIAATSLLDLAVPWVIGFLLLDRVIKKNDIHALPSVVLLLTGIFVCQRIAEFGQDYLQELANQRILNQIRCDLYAHTINLPVSFFDRGRTGDLLARLSGDIDTVKGFLETLMQDIGSQGVMLVGVLSFLFALNRRLTLYVLPTAVTLALSVLLFKKTVKQFSRRVRDLMGEMSCLAEEAISGVRVVKACCGQDFEVNKYRANSSELLRGQVRLAKLSSLYSSSVETCIFAGTVIVIAIGAPWVLAGGFTIGALVAYLSYVNKLYSPVKKLSKINLSIQKILAAGDRVFEIMDVPPEPLFAPHARCTTLAPIQVPRRLAGAIEFQNVGFEYDPGKPVLKNFNLRVEPGEVVALVAPSGAGKTTILNLLLGFYAPTSGRILFDGIPADQYPLEALRKQLAIVSQETFLFSGTARDNIAYSNPSATEQQVIDAARAAHAHEFLRQCPEGYQVQVGERGYQLSGGQRQRISIARALLRDPRIIIFDEATSHVDSESERLIQEALERVTKGRTEFVAAHRLSSVRHADKIVVIENGGVVEIGRHQELLARFGTYHRLHTLQFAMSDAVN
jgi:ATP-binding cassette, subfamily B, bacterial MsbA